MSSIRQYYYLRLLLNLSFCIPLLALDYSQRFTVFEQLISATFLLHPGERLQQGEEDLAAAVNAATNQQGYDSD